MIDLKRWSEKAAKSRLHLWLLNFGLSRTIPFNRPHGIKILRINKNSIETRLPYRRKNFNHIRGLHACALATLAEFTTGVLLVSRLDAKAYRIIMQSLNMEYLYQGKNDAVGRYTLEDGWLQEHVFGPLQHSDSVLCTCKTGITDVDGNLLAEGTVQWQVKPWTRVRTSVH